MQPSSEGLRRLCHSAACRSCIWTGHHFRRPHAANIGQAVSEYLEESKALRIDEIRTYPTTFPQKGIFVSFPLTRECLGGSRGLPDIKGQKRAQKTLDNTIRSLTGVCDRKMWPGGSVWVVIIDSSICRATTVMNSISGGDPLGRRHTFPCAEYSVRFASDTFCRSPDIPLPGHGTGSASKGRRHETDRGCIIMMARPCQIF